VDVKFFARFVVLPNRSTVHAGKLGRTRDDGRKHRLEIERGAHRLSDLAKRLQLSDGSRELKRSGLEFGEQTNILNRDDRLVRKSLQ
jgi:hypothetical protein